MTFEEEFKKEIRKAQITIVEKMRQRSEVPPDWNLKIEAQLRDESKATRAYFYSASMEIGEQPKKSTRQFGGKRRTGKAV